MGMFDDILAGAGFVGDIYSAYSAQQGQAYANRANVKLGREQMAFQERMSSSAMQRRVQDLKLAGLNPMLAATGPGASTPEGARGVVENPNAESSRRLGDASSRLIERRMASAQMTNLAAQTSKAAQEADLASAQAAAVRKATPGGEPGRLIESEIERNSASAAEARQRVNEMASQMQKIAAEISGIQLENQLRGKTLDDQAAIIKAKLAGDIAEAKLKGNLAEVADHYMDIFRKIKSAGKGGEEAGWLDNIIDWFMGNSYNPNDQPTKFMLERLTPQKPVPGRRWK